MFPFAHLSLRRVSLAAFGVVVLFAAALVVIPYASAAGAPGGANAAVNASCGGEVKISLANPSTEAQWFSIARSGRKSAPAVKVALPVGESTVATLALQRAKERFSVRVNGTLIADRYVTRQAQSAPDVASLPDAVAAMTAAGAVTSARIDPPACGSDAGIVLQNGTDQAFPSSVWHDEQNKKEADVELNAHDVVSITKQIAAVIGETVSVRSDESVLAKRIVTSRPPCIAMSAGSVSAASASSAAGVNGGWGDPVRIEDFEGRTLDTGKSGWYLYDSPKSSPPRSRDLVRTANNADSVSELQVVGTFDKATRAQMGSGAADRFNQKYGRWEVRARADKGSGFAPTILLWPQKEHWPTDGEIDLLELYQGDRQKGLAVVHNGPRNYFKTFGINIDHSQWHVYAVDWLPDHVTFFVDGKEVWTVRDRALVPTADAMHLVVQNDAGCGWIQCPNAQTAPETIFHIDWVKVYAAPGA